MGWGNLRVINEDYIEEGGGFGDHSHRNMEIITYVLSGQLAHKDSIKVFDQVVKFDVLTNGDAIFKCDTQFFNHFSTVLAISFNEHFDTSHIW